MDDYKPEFYEIGKAIELNQHDKLLTKSREFLEDPNTSIRKVDCMIMLAKICLS